MSDMCLGRDPKGPRRIAELTPEEAYMLKKQHDLKLYVHTCKDIEQVFLTYIQFHAITEKEYVQALVALRLLKPDKPSETVAWSEFYSRIRV